MENYVIVSKVKKFIKDKQGFNTSASFFEPVNQDMINCVKEAIEHAKTMNRKTVLGRDFSFYKEASPPEAALVVASKIKKLIKEEGGLNTSAQVVEQLSLRIEHICLNAIRSAVDAKRKTVMDKDFIASDS